MVTFEPDRVRAKHARIVGLDLHRIESLQLVFEYWRYYPGEIDIKKPIQVLLHTQKILK